MNIRNLLLIITALLLYSCTNYDRDLGKPLDIMYNEAITSLVNNNLEKASIQFQKIVDEYPYREEAIEAQIFLIWISYVKEDYVSAEVEIEAFLKYYVYNDYVPWVKYMEAMIHYDQIPNSQRDLSNARNALSLFFNIVKANSTNSYAKDAALKVQAIKYKLAQREMLIGQYYLTNKNYIAALSSYQNVLDLYYDTIFIQEAMYRMVYVWLILGVDKEAFKVASVLGYNYPDSIWYGYALDLIEKYTDYNDRTQIRMVK